MAMTSSDQRSTARDEARSDISKMWEIRAFEEKVMELSAKGQLSGLFHLGVGQEAVSVGACSALEKSDVVFAGHRARITENGANHAR